MLENNPTGLSLADAYPGQQLTVLHVADESALTDRLVELGFTPAAPVAVLRRAPMGGPLLLRVRNTVITLRVELARQVVVEARHD